MYEQSRDEYYYRKKKEPQTLWDLLMEELKDDESRDRKKFIEVIE